MKENVNFKGGDTKVFKKRPSKKILDEAFIEEQIKQDEGSDMNGGIITDRKKMRKKSSMDQFNDIVITKKFDNNWMIIKM